MWHEELSGRKGGDVASSYTKVCQHVSDTFEDTRGIIIWADNCTGQNKNWYLYTVLVQFINASSSLEWITLKYLEVGHTFMTADAVHGAIGRRIKKRMLPTFYSFKKECAASMKNIEVIEMQLGDFLTIQKQNRISSPKEPALRLDSIVQATFKRGESSVWVKTSFLGEETEFKILKKGFLKSNMSKVLPEKINERRGIPATKKNGIMGTLPKDISPEDKDFWDSLTVNDNSVDLGVTREKGELMNN